ERGTHRTERLELVDVARAVHGASQQLHDQWLAAVAPISLSSRNVSNRFSANGLMMSGTRPVAIVSAMRFPPTRVALQPHVPHPQSSHRLASGLAPMIGL